MSGDRYFINDQHSRYFLTLTVIHWIDLFTRKEYRDVLVDSLKYCQAAKGLEIYAWVIMSNHIHLVAACQRPHRMSDFLRDFKKFTSKQIISVMQEINESRREWLLDKFAFEARRTQRAKEYKIWTDDNHAIDLDEMKIDLLNKIDYVHNNPVEAGLVYHAEDYLYSSALDYSRKGKGLLAVTVV
jgi:REP element-mobilizing transposase RayT